MPKVTTTQSNAQAGMAHVLAVGLLLGFMVVVSGGGYYVYQKNQTAPAATTSQPDRPAPTPQKAQSATTTAANSAPAYVTVPDWQVRARYNGPIKLRVTRVEPTRALLTSEQFLTAGASLTGASKGCFDSNFVIERYKGSDYTTDTRMNESGDASTAAQTYAAGGTLGFGDSQSRLTKVGDYYYWAKSIPAPCPAELYRGEPTFTQTFQAVRTVTAQLQAAP